MASPLSDTAASLVEADLLRIDGDRRVVVAYPFSAQPTRHRVTLHDGRTYYAMCAIDALGIPYMLGQRGDVQAHEPDGPSIVRVNIGPPGRAYLDAAAGGSLRRLC